MALNQKEIEFAKNYTKCFSKAVESIKICFYPGCSNTSINSHILQKNGILSSIAPNRHLMWHGVDHFHEGAMRFKRTGINDAFSFNCFCAEHDSELFKPIETGSINFDRYRDMLLFTIRTIYNEKYRKLVNLECRKLMLKHHPEMFDIFSFKQILGLNENEKLGLRDIEKTENTIWGDYFDYTESFVFENRFLEMREICMSAFFTYETTAELEDYRRIHGKPMPETSDIFVNYFPHNGRSVFSMGYEKKNEQKIKSYVNTYFKESEKRINRRISNLLLFRCETWVCSEKLYNEKFKQIESSFAEAAHHSVENLNERKLYNLDLFTENFESQFKSWRIEIQKRNRSGI